MVPLRSTTPFTLVRFTPLHSLCFVGTANDPLVLLYSGVAVPLKRNTIVYDSN